MGWRDRLLNASPDTVGRAMKFGGGRILSQQDLPRAGMNKGGRAAKQIGGRANLLEEMGRIDARRHPDAADRAEKHRVIGELNRGYNKGGDVYKPSAADKKYGKYLGKKYSIKKLLKKPVDLKRSGKADGGRIGAKKGGDGQWIQKVNASIKRRGTKGKCTPITKPGCTGRAKALAKTFKKMAAKRKKS